MSRKAVGIGEVLWDLLPTGRKLGGAPANFAIHSSSLGAEVRMISRVGEDALGHEILERLQALGVIIDCLETDPKSPTGTVSVELVSEGQPKFTIHEGVAWDRLAGGIAAERAVATADALCFGSLAQRDEVSRATIRRLLALARPEALRIFDINLRQHFYSREILEQSLALSNALKMNDGELPELAKMFSLSGDARSQIVEIARRFGLRLVALTRGANGSLLFADGAWSDHSGVKAQVVDTVGAGDAFTAALALGFLASWNLDEINARANEIAAFVASSAGATPRLPEELRAPFLKQKSDDEH